MPLFAWKDNYSVGVEEIDRHHKKLFGIVNALYAGCLVPGGIVDVAGKIDELLAYAEYHFAEEEELMKRSGYEGRENHVKMHKKFIDKMVKLQQISFESEEELTKELIVFLGNWLLHHVMEEDKKYALWMR
jgi:hemerythrin-like metal-binding protein